MRECAPACTFARWFVGAAVATAPNGAYVNSMKRWMWTMGWVGSLVTGCVADGPGGRRHTDSGEAVPCEARPSPQLELGQDQGYGLDDGAAVRFGHPPQGGPPFAPFKLRIDGIYGGDHGVQVVIEAFDASDGLPIGDVALTHRFLCANTGPDADHLVAGEVHLRFWDETLDSLEGRTATVVARVDAMDGTFAEHTYTGPLQRVW